MNARWVYCDASTFAGVSCTVSFVFCSAARGGRANLGNDDEDDDDYACADDDAGAYEFEEGDCDTHDNASLDYVASLEAGLSNLKFRDGGSELAELSSASSPSPPPAAAAAAAMSRGGRGGKRTIRRQPQAASASVCDIEKDVLAPAKVRERKVRVKGVKPVKKGGKISVRAGGDFEANAHDVGRGDDNFSVSSSSSSSSVDFLPHDDIFPSPLPSRTIVPETPPSAYFRRAIPSRQSSTASSSSSCAAAAAAAVSRSSRAFPPTPIIICDTPSPEKPLPALGKENAADTGTSLASKMRGKKVRESGAGGKRAEVVVVSSGSDGEGNSDEDLKLTLRERVLRMMKKKQ
jgi:hypothetical protein